MVSSCSAFHPFSSQFPDETNLISSASELLDDNQNTKNFLKTIKVIAASIVLP
jgi:hypothetical protein